MVMPTKPFSYSAYGLTISSEVALPDLLPASGSPDVLIRRGTVPATLDSSHYVSELLHVSPNAVLLHVKERIGAAFMIANGKEIVVDLADDAQNHFVSAALLGYCITALLFQRGLLVLHGNAVQTRFGAIVICGHRKAGKSTTSAALCRRGATIVADDVSAIDTSKAVPVVKPGVPRVRLWYDALDHFDQSHEHLERVVPDLNKYNVPYNENFCDEQSPLSAIYVIGQADVAEPVIRRMSGAEQMKSIFTEIRSYLPDQLPLGKAWLFREAATLAAKVQIAAIKRPVHENTIDAVADLILQDLQSYY